MPEHFRIIATLVTVVFATTGCYAPRAGSPMPSFDGASLYRGYCASCHGQKGAGDGPMVGQLTMAPTDLRTLSARNDGVFPRATIGRQIDGRNLPAAHGSREMPLWGWQLAQTGTDNRDPAKVAQARIGALLDYLEGIQAR